MRTLTLGSVSLLFLTAVAPTVVAQPPDGGVPEVPPPPTTAEPSDAPLAEPRATPTTDEQAGALPPAEPPDATLAERIVETLGAQIHGFVSQGYIVTTRNDYLAHSERNGSFEMTEAGINFTTQPLDQLRMGIQLFARDLGPIGNYDIKLDWFYLDYRFTDWFGIRAGRTKIPFGLYNEYNDIDAGRVPILLPQSLYPATSRDFLLAQTGAEIYGRIAMGAGGALEYRIYGGTIFLEVPANQAGSPFTITALDVPYLVGGRLLWELPVPGLRIGLSGQALRLSSQILVGGMPVGVDVKPALLWVASAEYATGDLLIAAEYGRWHTKTISDDPLLFPVSNAWDTSERAYALVTYQIVPWFHPGIYYSVLFPDFHDREGRASRQHDVALTLRFDINDFWLVKLEGHYMRGTAALSASLNGASLDTLTENWAAFLVKTTGYF